MTGTDHSTLEPPPARRGRPPDPTRDIAIMDAALDGIAEVGYDRLSMEDIAARAGAGRATLYRRWPTKAQLVTDAVRAWRERTASIEAPDTGTLLGDLRALADAAPDFDRAAQQRIAVIIGLVAAANRDPELRAALTDAVLERPRQVLQRICQHAIDRGEIREGAPVTLAADIMMGLSALYAIQGTAISRGVLRDILLGAVAPLLQRAESTSDDDQPNHA